MPDDSNHPLKVFLCHAHSDRDAVKTLYARLKREGVDVWLDKEKLLPGADWKYEIRKAVREADVVVVCLSKQFNQAGFRQKEVRIALEEADKKPEGEIFIIPARLEECDNLESLSRWHWVDLFESDGFQRLILALRVRAEKIGAALRQRGHATISRPKINAEQEAARERAEQEAIEKTRLDAEELERQKTAQENANREAAREKAERDAIEKAQLEAEELARQKSAREIAEKTDRETAEKARLQAEKLARQRAAKASQPKKANPNTAVIVASIGLAGIIFAALIGPPLLGELFSPTPEPTATLFFTPTKTKTPAPTRTPTQAFTVTATPYPTEITDNGVPMRLVPAGEFTMGSEHYDDEKPVHPVYLDAFYMDKYEVTNTFYKACVEAGGCQPPKNTIRYDDPNYDNHPVVYVDWNQAKAYCEWRDDSLPTEAQWEKAARSTDNRTYPWGEGIDCDKANYSSCKGDTTPVGSYENGKSPYGIYDLAGNVWEWTADWYLDTYYKNSPSENPLGPDTGTYRVLRGGSWYYGYLNARSASRNGDFPDYLSYNYYNIGFRCARSLP